MDVMFGQQRPFNCGTRGGAVSAFAQDETLVGVVIP